MSLLGLLEDIVLMPVRVVVDAVKLPQKLVDFDDMQIQIIMLVIVATLFQGCGCDIIIKEERPDSINRLTLEVPDKTNQVVA